MNLRKTIDSIPAYVPDIVSDYTVTCNVIGHIFIKSNAIRKSISRADKTCCFLMVSVEVQQENTMDIHV